MLFEIINPSDKCFLESDNPEAVSAAVAFLGNGQYGLKDENDKKYPAFGILGHDINADWKEEYGRTIQDYMDTNPYADIAKALSTFRYNSERSSLNNIGAAAKQLEKHFKERAVTSANKTKGKKLKG